MAMTGATLVMLHIVHTTTYIAAWRLWKVK